MGYSKNYEILYELAFSSHNGYEELKHSTFTYDTLIFYGNG